MEARKRVNARSPRLRLKIETTPGKQVRGKHVPETHVLGPDHADQDGFWQRLLDAFGTRSQNFAQTELQRLARALGPNWRRSVSEEQLNAALAVVDGIKPDNEVEALLAIQMAMAHVLAMQAMARAHWADEVAVQQTTSKLAVKFGRLFTLQVEAMAKLRRKGEQTVRVEHVHVYPGGQAIVGPVSGGGGSQT